MMKRRILNSITLLLLPALILTGCWHESDLNTEPEELLSEEELQSTESPDSEENHINLPEQFALPYLSERTLDPITCSDGMQQVVSSLLYEGLFQSDTNLEPIPRLCSAYTYDSTTLTYTFTLRDGVTFSDGSPLTGADVKDTLNRARTSERYQARLSHVTDVANYGNTVTVSLSKADSGFPALMDIPIVKSTTATATAPIGTGPYLLSQEETGAYLVANQIWWQGNGQPAERIALVEASNQDSMLYRFTSHEVQLITADLTGISPISATGHISYQDADTTILQYLGCNTRRAPLNDAAFRRALYLGIDRTHIVDALLSGHGTVTQFPISPVSPLYPVNLETRFSHDAFSTALTEAAYTAERPLTLLVNAENSFKVSIAQYLAETFTAAGIPVTVNSLPWEDYTHALSTGNFDLYYGEVKLTANWDISPLLSSSGKLNYGGWSDEQTNELLTAYAMADNRAVAMQTLCQHLQEQAPILPICFKSTSVLMYADVVSGLTPTMTEPFFNLTDCTIHLQNTPNHSDTESAD